MKVQELLMNIHNKEFNLERGLQVKKYLPIEVKKTIARGILYESTIEEDGVTKIDSVQRYLSYVKYMITMHTNLDYTDADYDALCSTTYKDKILLNAIMSCFEADATECSRILNLVTDDYVQEHSVENAVYQFLYKLNNSLDGFASILAEKVKDVDLTKILPQDYDVNKLNSFLKHM